MLAIDAKAARATWTVFLIGLFIFLAYKVRHTLLIFTLALFFAYVLSPMVNFVSTLLPKRLSRNFTIALVYLLFLGALVGASIGIGSTIADQAAALAGRLPELVKNKDSLLQLPLPGWLDPLRARIVDGVRSQVDNLDKEAFPLIKQALGQVASKAGSILQFVLVPILAFFLLKDAAVIREALIGWTTRGRASVMLEEILADVHILLGHYIRALIILSFATFVVFTAFLEFTGAQYSLLLGGIAAILEFIPVVGPLAGAVIILIVQGITGYDHLLAMIVFLIVYRMFQDYVLSPYLMGSGVELHPLLVLFGVLAGEQIAGIPGMFFSVPVLAALRIVYVHARRSRVRTEPVPPKPILTEQ